MNVAEFEYHLPEERIAQTSVSPRDQAKMLVMNRETGALSDAHVFDIPSFLRAGDLLIFNDTKVFKARLHGIVRGKEVEVFLLHAFQDHHSSPSSLSFLRKQESIEKIDPRVHEDDKQGISCWSALLKPGKHVRVGDVIAFDDSLSATLLEKSEDGTARVRFNASTDDVFTWVDAHGQIPSPPYVAQVTDASEYQTVYARVTGSVAAPTAGFHFTEELLSRLDAMGVARAFVTLHVGLGTFRPMKTETLDAHVMHEEWGHVPQETVDAIIRTKAQGGRVIVVGTTAMRAVESMAINNSTSSVIPAEAGIHRLDDSPLVRGRQMKKGEKDACIAHEWSGWTSIFITPGFEFRVADGLLTNFHLPKSTLLVLVSAFAGREHVMRAYEHAIKHEYRFYSFGDAMLMM